MSVILEIPCFSAFLYKMYSFRYQTSLYIIWIVMLFSLSNCLHFVNIFCSFFISCPLRWYRVFWNTLFIILKCYINVKSICQTVYCCDFIGSVWYHSNWGVTFLNTAFLWCHVFWSNNYYYLGQISKLICRNTRQCRNIKHSTQLCDTVWEMWR